MRGEHRDERPIRHRRPRRQMQEGGECRQYPADLQPFPTPDTAEVHQRLSQTRILDYRAELVELQEHRIPDNLDRLRIVGDEQHIGCARRHLRDPHPDGNRRFDRAAIAGKNDRAIGDRDGMCAERGIIPCCALQRQSRYPECRHASCAH